jgi:hypothetical protein
LTRVLEAVFCQSHVASGELDPGITGGVRS